MVSKYMQEFKFFLTIVALKHLTFIVLGSYKNKFGNPGYMLFASAVQKL